MLKLYTQHSLTAVFQGHVMPCHGSSLPASPGKREGFILSHPLSVFPYHYLSTIDPYSFFYILPLLQGQMVES
jgi:hypothetical protein